jgi:outer membrane protein TolC
MKFVLSIFSILLTLNATTSLTLEEALSILKTENLEIKAATIDVDVAKQDADSVSGMNWGKLDFVQDFANSNDAGNVFGFKLTSREATFGDFGAKEFMNATGKNGGVPPESAYTTPPQDLNYPDARSFFQSKLKYEVPLFTGFALSSYADVMNSMIKIKSLEKRALINEKTYQLRKSYYDMALLNDSIANLEQILTNIEKLEDTTQNMIDVGYAKRIDLLEVKAKKGNVERLLVQMKSNEKLLYHYISFLLNTKITTITAPKSEVQVPTYDDEAILSDNLDIQKASTGLEIRQSMVDSSQAAYYPTLGAFAEVATADDSFLGEASDHSAYTVGARLTWNLFNGGIDSSKIEKSKLEHLKMQSQVDLAKQGISLKLAKIRTEIDTADQEIASLKKELELAEFIYTNYLSRYKEKLSSMNDVIIKQSMQIEKILQLQMAKNKRNEKIFALEKLANQGK